MGVSPFGKDNLPPQIPDPGSKQSTNKTSFDDSRKAAEKKKQEEAAAKKKLEDQQHQGQAELQIDLRQYMDAQETQKAEGIKASAGAQAITAAKDRILGYLKSLSIASVEGGELLHAEIQTGAQQKMDQAFDQARLVIKKTNDGISVNISNATNEQRVLRMILESPEKLRQFVTSMANENMKITSFTVGNHEIPLPSIQKTSILDPTMHQKQGGQQQQRGKESPPPVQKNTSAK